MSTQRLLGWGLGKRADITGHRPDINHEAVDADSVTDTFTPCRTSSLCPRSSERKHILAPDEDALRCGNGT